MAISHYSIILRIPRPLMRFRSSSLCSPYLSVYEVDSSPCHLGLPAGSDVESAGLRDLPGGVDGGHVQHGDGLGAAGPPGRLQRLQLGPEKKEHRIKLNSAKLVWIHGQKLSARVKPQAIIPPLPKCFNCWLRPLLESLSKHCTAIFCFSPCFRGRLDLP